MAHYVCSCGIDHPTEEGRTICGMEHKARTPHPSLPGYEMASTLCPPCAMASVPVARCYQARCHVAWAKDGKERQGRNKTIQGVEGAR